VPVGYRTGGITEPPTNNVDVALSDGERATPPEVVMALGKGDINLGHKICEALLKKFRDEDVKRIASLPGPAK
jgi:hypothetical protein